MKKYIILIAAVLMLLCLGSGLAWSTFVPVLKFKYGLSTAQTQVIFGSVCMMMTLFTLVGGRLQDRMGPRLPAFIGGIVLGAGYILAGYSSGTYSALLTFIGIFVGVGLGMCYLCPLVCVVKWFPYHKSLVTGISVAAYASSAIIFSQLGEYLLAQQIDVLVIFKYMGYLFLTVISITSLFLKNPPSAVIEMTNQPSIKTLALLKDRNFWGLFCAIFPGFCIGLMIYGNIKPFGLSLNLNPVVAGAGVSIIALFNALGRVSWGIMGGFIKGKKLILISIISITVVCLATPLIVRNELTFKLFAVTAGFTYASYLVLYAAEVANTYGTEKMGTIYSTLFTSQGIAGFIAPPLAGKIYDSVGSYTPAFLIFGSLSFISIFLFHFVYQPDRVIK